MNFRNTNAVLIRQQCRQLEEKLQQSLGEQIRIYPGQEIFYSEEVIDLLDKGKLLTLADSPYVLVEFHPAASVFFYFQQYPKPGLCKIFSDSCSCGALFGSSQKGKTGRIDRHGR